MLGSIRDHLVGTVIDGRYELSRFIGEGAFAWVYEAAEVLGTQHIGRVAVKLIEVRDEEHRSGLVREIQALAQLSHPNVLGYRTAGVVSEGPLQGTFYIVTELADTSLEAIRVQGAWGDDDLRQVACQISAALAHIHARGAIHRDVKPANILRVNGMWKLADFGLSRAVGGSVVSASGHKDTLGYMAPELLDGHVGAVSDVYSLGVTLLQCLTGRLAHEGSTEGEFIRNLLTKPAGIPDEVAEPWRTALSRCLAQAPRDRCVAGDVAELLSGAAGGAQPRRRETRRPRDGSRAGDEITGPDGGTYVWVPAGEFMMGSEDDHDDEKPVHPVRLTRGFWLSKCQVTNAQYQRFCEVTGREFPSYSNQGDEHPVVRVSWEDAVAYCEYYGLRLPTEAEWEYAGRGAEGRVYPWGNEWDRRCCCNTDNTGPGGQTYPVGSFPSGASWCGALDMAGNVFEWCEDWYDEDYYGVSPEVDPPGPASGTERVSRGGGWMDPATFHRSACRNWSEPTRRDGSSGFRPVVAPR